MRPVLAITMAAVAAALTFGVSGAQLPPQGNVAEPSFEVASVRPNKSGDNRIQIGFQPGGRFTATGVTLRMLIGVAYAGATPLADFQIEGGPSWSGSDRFDIVAKAEGDVVPGPNGPIPAMIRSLLAD